MDASLVLRLEKSFDLDGRSSHGKQVVLVPSARPRARPATVEPE